MNYFESDILLDLVNLTQILNNISCLFQLHGHSAFVLLKERAQKKISRK